MRGLITCTCLLIMALLMATCIGCSSPAGLTTPQANPPNLPDSTDEDPSRAMWGMWMVTVDVNEEVVEATQIRNASFHLNALHFLEPPPGILLTLEGPPQFSPGKVEVDVGLRHPFLGVDRYTGFDVCGILISSGNYTINDDGELRLAYEGDVYLANADGLTRWWNPDEFPYNSQYPNQSYKDGLLGWSDAVCDFNCNLNGYKYFADALESDQSVTEIEPSNRGYFSAGQKNIRHYVIKHPGMQEFFFNYAIDASWAMPANPNHPEVPDDFPPAANKGEPYHLDVREITNTLHFDEDTGEGGGKLFVEVDAYQWFLDGSGGGQLSIVGLKDPALIFNGVFKSNGPNYTTYTIEFDGLVPDSLDDIQFVVIAPGSYVDYQGILPGETVTEYSIFTADVEPYSGPTPTEWLMFQHDARFSGQSTVIGPQTNHVEYTELHKYGNALTVLTGPGDDIYCTFFGSIYDNRPLQAVNRVDGSLHWMQDYNGPEESCVKAMCIDPNDGWIYAYYSGDNTIRKLDPADGSDVCTPLDVYKIGSNQFGVIHDNGYIYVPTFAHIHCFDSDLQEIWKTDVEWTVNSSPAIDLDGNIIAYGGDFEGYCMYWLDPLNGSVLNTFPLEHAQATPTVMSDNTIIMPTNGGDVYAINSDGSQKWKINPLGSNSGAGVCSAAEGINGDIYIVMFHWGDWDEQLLRLDPDDGSLLGATSTAYNLKSSTNPAIGADGIIYCNGNYRLYAFNPDLSLKWESEVVGDPGGGKSMGPCSIDAAGDLYAASGSHGFICIRDE